MHSLRLLIALTMVLGLGYSQCTGGLLNIPYAIASEVESSSIAHTALRYARTAARATPAFAEASVGRQGDTPMSLAPPIECSSAETESSAQTSSKQSGCKDGESCLEQVARSGAKHLATVEISGGATQETLPAPITAASAVIEHDSGNRTTRKGPLFERATLAAHSTVKRE